MQTSILFQYARIRILISTFILWIAACLSAPANDFVIATVQETQVRLDGGLLEGLAEGMQGEVFYSITVAGQVKRIVPAKITLIKVEDRQSIGMLKEQTGTVKSGYYVSLAPRPAGDMLTALQSRAAEVFAGKDFELAKKFYQKILTALPNDPFATQKARECDTQIEKQVLLQNEMKKIPYYKQVIKTSMTVKSDENIKLVLTYADKILAIVPGDPDVPEYKRWARSAAPPPPLKDMIWIPESEFPIGSEPGKTPFANEIPRQKIRVAAFYIDKYEVTNEDYKRFCDATGHPYPQYFANGTYPEGKGRRPVVMVSWIDANAYARWAGKRLPGEFEWEAAAAGVPGHVWPWGDAWDPNAANTFETVAGGPADAGGHPGDASAYGVFDMAGNVSEWTADWYRLYPGNAGKEEFGEQFKIVRGGSFQKPKELARCQSRGGQLEDFRSTSLGFRCAITAPKKNAD